jgi:CRISPR-associated protein Cmr5
MSKINVEKYIPDAIREIEEILIEDVVIKQDNKEKIVKGVNKSYNSYISSFGASLIQSGLKATIALFENINNQDKTNAPRYKLMTIILNILKKHYKNSTKDRLLEYLLEQENDKLLQEKIVDIAIAIKLAIRTFPLGEKKDKNE